MAGWVLFPYGCQGFFGYPWHALDISVYEVHRHQCFLFGENVDRFTIRNVYSMAPLWSGTDLEVGGSLGNWARVILLDIPSLNFVCVVSSPRFHPLCKAPWEDHLPHPQALELYRSSKFLHSPWTKKMPPKSWALQLRQRERRLKILLLFNRIRNSTLLLRPRTVACADRARFLIILQMPIKNVQELAKEEREESEAKLREAIEISEGAISAIVGSWRDLWRATS